MIWIDTDGGVDDALAIAVATKLTAASDLTLSSVFGNVSATQAAYNVQSLLRLLKINLPVCVGANAALDGFAQDATNIHGADGLGNVVGSVGADQKFELLTPKLSQLGKQSVGASSATHILGIGPATNIPSIAAALGSKRIAGITLMTGAIFDRGNITEHAEFNLYNDPQALAETLRSGSPVTIVPLDICRKVIFNLSDLPSLSAFGPAQEMLSRAHKFYMASYRESDAIDGCFPHDAIALLSMMYPSKFEFWNLSFDLDFSGERRGKMRFNAEGKYHARFCLGGDLRWLRRLLNSWAFPPIELLREKPDQFLLGIPQ
jgi:inosine-uridine nucleoside N-ribohydrolase